MRDLITSAVRTGVQVVVAAVVAYLANLGIDIDAVSLEIVLFGLVSGVVTLALNYAQSKLPWLGSVLSLGLSKSTPTY